MQNTFPVNEPIVKWNIIYKRTTYQLSAHTYKNETIPKTNAGLAIENRIQLLEPLNIDTNKIIRPKIFLSDSEKAEAKRFLKTIPRRFGVFHVKKSVPNGVHKESKDLVLQKPYCMRSIPRKRKMEYLKRIRKQV